MAVVKVSNAVVYPRAMVILKKNKEPKVYCARTLPMRRTHLQLR